jgi:spermidine synthase
MVKFISNRNYRSGGKESSFPPDKRFYETAFYRQLHKNGAVLSAGKTDFPDISLIVFAHAASPKTSHCLFWVATHYRAAVRGFYTGFASAVVFIPFPRTFNLPLMCDKR